MHRRAAGIWIGAAALLAGCLSAQIDPASLFPPQVGEFLRTSGPAPDAETGVEAAVYQSSAGTVTLRVRQIGAEQIPAALSELPPLASDIGYNAALGQREGVFFSFADAFHAAWGNGDWIFVLSASSSSARQAFLSAYGY